MLGRFFLPADGKCKGECKMKKSIALFLALLTLIGVVSVPTIAAEVPEGTYGTDYVKYGDGSLDEVVSAADALMTLQSVVGKVQLNDVQEEVLDVDDNQVVSAADALMILQYVVGKVTEFTPGIYYVINETIEKPEPTGNYILDYDKSNSVNGAYVADKTADTSFKVDLSSLKPFTLYRATSAAVGSSTDSARLFYSLQGLINRDFGLDEKHTSMLYLTKETSDAHWLNTITADGSILQDASEAGAQDGMSEVRVNTWDTFKENFMGVIKSCGIILWDGNVPATANVAATICGLDGYLPVLAESPLHKELVEAGVEVKMSLVGMFKNGQKGQKITGTDIASTGSAKNDAYLWALEKYFPRCSSKYLAYTLDGAPCIKGYEAYEDHPTALLSDAGTNCLPNHDYLIARRCFFFDLAPYALEAACDDPAQQNDQADWGVDNETMLKIYQARYDRAKGEFGFLMGFPPWWVKYTSHHGQGGQVATWIEWLYCEYITCYNLAKEADAAHPAQMTNGSAYYKYIPGAKKYTNNKASTDTTFDKDTYYYTIYVGDYDSSAWLKQHIYTMWAQRGGDKKRGTLPLMWSINPNLSDRVPMIFEYMYNNKTDLDYMAGGDGGAGYIIPEALFHDNRLAYMGEKRPAGNAAGGDAFARFSKTYYDRFDMDVTGFIINGAQHTVTKSIAACVTKYSPVINFTNCFNTRVGKYSGTYFVYCQNGIGPGSESTMYSHAQTTLNAGYNFSAYRTVCKTPTEINGMVSGFKTYASDKGLKVAYVDPYTYAKVLKQSGQGAAIQ